MSSISFSSSTSKILLLKEYHNVHVSHSLNPHKSFPLYSKSYSLRSENANKKDFLKSNLFNSNPYFQNRKSALISSSSVANYASSFTSVDDYLIVEDCKVYIPNAIELKSKIKGIIYFIGCAYLGGAPDLSYSYLFEILNSEGYVVVAVPYNLTFKHEECANSIHSRFTACMNALSSIGLSQINLSGDDISSLPIYGLSHSNGALMHVMIGSLFTDDKLPSANVLVSFNNKPAKDAIPFFDQLGPQASQLAPMVEAFPLTGIVLSFAEQALQSFEKSDINFPPLIKEEIAKLSPLANQVPSVFSEVFNGFSEFTPSPEENKKLISSSYSIPKNLLIKFKIDSLDETDALKSLFQSRFELTRGEFSLVELDGTHATPLAQDLRWRVQREYSPLDAIAQSLKSSYLKDLKTFAMSVVDWLDGLEIA